MPILDSGLVFGPPCILFPVLITSPTGNIPNLISHSYTVSLDFTLYIFLQQLQMRYWKDKCRIY